MEIGLVIWSAACSLAAIVLTGVVLRPKKKNKSGVLHIISDEDGDHLYLALNKSPRELAVGQDVVFTVVRDNYNDFNGTDIH